MATNGLEKVAPGAEGQRFSGYEALRHARQAMDDAIIAPAIGDPLAWGRGLHDALAELADILRRHREASERPGGTLEEMAHLEPRLVPRLDRSRAEHQPLIERADALQETVAAQMAAGKVDVNHLRQEAGRLQSDVRHHMAVGVDLMYEAYERDMGGEG